MGFSHPLARGAKIWPSTLHGGSSQKLLVIVTTLELDSAAKKYKSDKVDRLRSAAQEWLSYNMNQAEGYMLVNRFKDWNVGVE